MTRRNWVFALGFWANYSVEMAHFTTCFDVGLTIKMQRDVGLFGKVGHARHVGANQVLHDHIGVALPVAQGPACDRADVLFELVDDAAVLGPMA